MLYTENAKPEIGDKIYDENNAVVGIVSGRRILRDRRAIACSMVKPGMYTPTSDVKVSMKVGVSGATMIDKSFSKTLYAGTEYQANTKITVGSGEGLTGYVSFDESGNLTFSASSGLTVKSKSPTSMEIMPVAQAGGGGWLVRTPDGDRD